MSDALYQALGVQRTASEAEIRRAYRKLAKQLHPDTNRDDKNAEERFKRVSSAYKILKDKDQRARYDRGEIDDQGNERATMGGFGGGFGGRGRPGGDQHFEFQGGPGGFGGFEDIISDLFGGRGGGAGRGGVGRGRAASRGGDIQYRLTIDLKTAARGGRERIRLGDGRDVDVNIPSGVETGKQLRLRGKGQPGAGGGQAGDVLIEIDVQPHPTLRRDGLDILLDQPLPLATAVNGGKVRVETLDGDVSLTIPAWTSSGKSFRLKGRGVHDAQGTKGDQLVRVMLQLPEQPDPKLAKLLGAEASQTA